jgi:hypothetical protein
LEAGEDPGTDLERIRVEELERHPLVEGQGNQRTAQRFAPLLQLPPGHRELDGIAVGRIASSDPHDGSGLALE